MKQQTKQKKHEGESACQREGCYSVVGEKWGKGPWNTEVSRVDFKAHGFDCFIHRSRLGAWCGYVGVPRSHPAFGVHYDGVSLDHPHGGLTYADKCGGHLCHPKPAARWWLGFDCSHGGDYAPKMEADMQEIRKIPIPGLEPSFPPHRKEWDGPPVGFLSPVTEEPDGTRVMHEHYWTQAEVIGETKRLAAELSRVTGHSITRERKRSTGKMLRDMGMWTKRMKFHDKYGVDPQILPKPRKKHAAQDEA